MIFPRMVALSLALVLLVIDEPSSIIEIFFKGNGSWNRINWQAGLDGAVVSITIYQLGFAVIVVDYTTAIVLHR